MSRYTRRDLVRMMGTGMLSRASGAAGRKPNIVLILADDLGWRDTSLYGSTFYETPNIQRLARRGLMFTQAYAANPLCSPTRASILTGLHPARIGITTPSCHLPQVVLEQKLTDTPQPGHRAVQANSITRLRHEYFTLAEALKEAGYTTAHFGKWHLGHEPYDPLHQGFDIDLPHAPIPGPVGGYLAPWRFWPDAGKPGEHIEDRMAEEASQFIAANKDRPFFVNYWAFSVHSPWNAKPELIEKYRAKAGSSGGQRNPVNAAMVQSLDEAVGRVMRAVDDAGVANNTIIVFFSDNGGVHWTLNQEPGVMHPEFRGIPATSNAPLRGGKATLYEGGTREPCVFVWPGTAKPGSQSEEIVSSVDFYPTLLEMAGLKAKSGQKFDGISIVPALKGSRLKREAVFCHFPHYTPRTGAIPGTWVRQSDWKLIRLYCDNEDQTDRFELYNLKEDIGEKNNLAARMPARVRKLNSLIDGFLKETGAIIPRQNPGYVRAAR